MHSNSSRSLADDHGIEDEDDEDHGRDGMLAAGFIPPARCRSLCLEFPCLKRYASCLPSRPFPFRGILAVHFGSWRTSISLSSSCSHCCLLHRSGRRSSVNLDDPDKREEQFVYPKKESEGLVYVSNLSHRYRCLPTGRRLLYDFGCESVYIDCFRVMMAIRCTSPLRHLFTSLSFLLMCV